MALTRSTIVEIISLCFFFCLCFSFGDACSTFEGTTWSATEVVDDTTGQLVAIDAAGTVTTTFTTSGVVSGFGGCNKYKGSFVNTGTTNITVGSQISVGTKICTPAAVTNQESDVLQGLFRTESYTVNCNQLSLFDAERNVVLSYTSRGGGGGGQAPTNPVTTSSPVGTDSTTSGCVPKALVGTTWSATQIFTGGALQAIVSGSSTTAVFLSDGTVRGFGGCDKYSGPYTTSGSNGITFGQNFRWTKHTCSAAITTQENDYQTDLWKTKTFNINCNTLTLLNNKGIVFASFQASNSAAGQRDSGGLLLRH